MMTADEPTDTHPPSAEKLAHLDHKRSAEEAEKIQDINKLIEDLGTKLERVEQTLDSNRADLETAIKDGNQQSEQLDAQLYKALDLIHGLEKSRESMIRKAALMGIEIQKLSHSLKQEIEQSGSEIREKVNQNALASEEHHNQLLDQAKVLTEKDRELGNRLEQYAADQNAALSDQKLIQAEKNGIFEGRLSSSDQQLKHQDEQIAQLHKQEQGLNQRTSSLELSAKGLSERANLLEATSRSLQIHTSELTASVAALNVQTEELYERTEKNKTRIITLGGKIRRHFIGLAIGLLLLALIVAGLSYYESRLWEQQATADTHFSDSIDKKIATLHNRVDSQNSEAEKLAAENRRLTGTVQALESELSHLGTNIETVKEKTETMGDQIESVKEKTETMGDQIETVNAGVAILAPNISFGKDNTLHGQAWLERQPPGHYAIQLASETDKKTLFRTAQRYSHYLKEELSYFATTTESGQKYILVYGNFTNRERADSARYRLPRYIDGQQPAVKNIGALQQLAKN